MLGQDLGILNKISLNVSATNKRMFAGSSVNVFYWLRIQPVDARQMTDFPPEAAVPKSGSEEVRCSVN
jgi:hypothetical protein